MNIAMIAETAVLVCGFALLLSGIAPRAKAHTRAGTISNQDGRSSQNSGIGDEGPATLLTAPGAGSYQPLTGRERWSLYLREAFWSPGVFFRAAGPALGAQLNNEPPAWGQGAGGYSKRFANRFGRFALQETYEAAGAAALGHEVRYVPSKRSGVLRRTAHALTANFVTYGRSGRRKPHLARVGSVVAAEFTGSIWMPAGYRGASTAIRGVGMELGVSSCFNLIREFAPELKRIFTGN